ncbi:apoptosis facilitator Bcl-2-like protein 14 [Lates japonicus]
MTKGIIEIHDPLSDRSDLKNSTDANHTSTSDTDSMEDTVELRIMMAYAKRRRAEKDAESVKLNGNTHANGTSAPQVPAETEPEPTEKKKKKEKKAWKRVLSSFKCIKPKTQDDDDHISYMPDNNNRSAGLIDDEPEHKEELEGVADQLAKIADEIPFTPPETDLETDSPNDAVDDVDSVEKMIGLLLRESGDRLNEKELKDLAIARELFWNYDFFKTIIRSLLQRMGLWNSNPDSPGPHTSLKTQIAVTCEATSRLSAMDTLPMNRLLGYGARYLSEHYSSWAQEQGGYDIAFKDDDEDDIQ